MFHGDDLKMTANELLVWRLAGAAVWQSIVVTSIFFLFQFLRSPFILFAPLKLLSSLFDLSRWIALLSLLLSIAPATISHFAIITTDEKPSKHQSFHQYLPAVLTLCIRKLSSRASTTSTSVVILLAYLVAHVLSAALFHMTILSSMKQSTHFHHLLNIH